MVQIMSVGNGGAETRRDVAVAPVFGTGGSPRICEGALVTGQIAASMPPPDL